MSSKEKEVNWFDSIPKQYLYANANNFQKRNEPIPTDPNKLKEEDALVLLKGFRYLADLRGFRRVDYDVIECSESSCSVVCSITWLPLSKGEPEIVYSSMASVNQQNASNFSQKFAVACAENRSFARCVRNFLNIRACGVDEIDSRDFKMKSFGGENEEINVKNAGEAIKPQNILKQKCKEVGFLDFASFEAWVNKQYSDEYQETDWKDFSDIPGKECRIFIGALKDI
jgi:hypothetical protein